MSWRDARAKVDRGFYKKQDNAIGDGFAKAANIIAKSWMQEAADEKVAKKERLKEEKDERKRVRAAQQKAEVEEKKLKDNAIYLARTYTNDPSNVAAVKFFYENLSLMGGDVGDVMTYADRLIEDNRLSFIPPTTKTETVEYQGPNVPANAKLKDFGGTVGSNFTKDGRDVTLGDLPNIIINDTNSSSLKAQASEMNDMFGDLAEGTTLPEPGEVEVPVPGGIELTAAGQEPIDIDFTRLGSLDEISLYEQELSKDGKPIDSATQKIFNDRKNTLKTKDNNEWLNSLSGDTEAQDRQLRAMEINSETETERYTLLTALQTADKKDIVLWKAIIDPSETVDLDVNKLRDRMALAKQMGAKDEDLTTIQAQIKQKEEVEKKKPIQWSTINSDNYEGTAKEFEDKGRPEDAQLIREYGKSQLNPAMSDTELDAASDDLLAIISAQTTDTEYKTRIDRIIAQKLATSNAEQAKSDLEERKGLVSKDVSELEGIVNSVSYPIETRQAAALILSSKSSADFDLKDYDNVENSTIKAIIASKGVAAENIVKLQTLLNARSNNAPKIMAGSETFLVQYKEGNIIKSTTAKLTADGKYVDLNNPTRLITPAQNTQVVNLDLNADLYDDIIKIQQSIIVPIDEQREAMASTLESAKKLDDLVNPALGGDPTILTTVGGKVAPFMQRVGLEIATMVDMFNSDGNNVNTVNSFVNSTVAKYIQASQGLSDKAKAAALFEAERIKLAFSFAASALGQSGQGLSNDDFKYSLTVVSIGNTYDKFSTNIRSQVQSIISKTDRIVGRFRKNTAVNLLKRNDPTLFQGYEQTAEQYANDNNLSGAYAWAKGETSGNPNLIPPRPKPTLQEFLDKMKPKNPDYTVQELTDFYNSQYGDGE